MLDFASSNPQIVLFLERLSVIGIIIPMILAMIACAFSKDDSPEQIALSEILSLFMPLLPIIVFSSTKYNIEKLTPIPECETVVGPLYWYLAILIIFYILWFCYVFYKKYKNGNNGVKKQIKIILIGFSIFVVWSLFTNVILQIFGYSDASLYGPIGAIFLVGAIAYAIVKHQFLNIKLIGAQALVYTLVVIIGAQFFFIQNNINKILTGATLAMAIGFGWMLIFSVKKEIKRKEELEIINKELSERKEQLQKMSDNLAVANDKLRQLDQAKTDFINIASHQLKKAPTPIKGYASMLLEGSYGKLSPEQEAAVRKIDTANDRQLHIVEDLLNIARIESGKMEFDFEKIDPVSLCQEVYDNLATIAKDKKLDFQYEKPKKALPKISIDKGKIFEAIFNFVENAIKYTPSGSVKLKVEQIADNIRISVVDTGVGISKDCLVGLFEKFTRGKDQKNLHIEGSGLGLYVVRIVIEAHNGRTWAESDGEGKGSRFFIEIPVKRAEETLAKN